MRKAQPMRRTDKGFSLIELMVAITIGLFLSAVIGSIYVASKGSFSHQDAMSRLQENARFAMERIARDVRMAGYNGCGQLGTVANVLNNSSSKWWLDFEKPVMGYNSLTSSDTRFPSAVAGTDAISLLGVSSENELTVINHTLGNTTMQTAKHSLQPGEILVATNCSQTSVFQMSGPSNPGNDATTISHGAGGSSPGNCTGLLGASCSMVPTGYTLKAGSSVMRMYANAYYIRLSETAGQGNALWTCSITGQTNGQPLCSELLNGVDNMQIEYGVDTDGDNSANAYVAADDVSNWDNVVSVKISLLMATPPSAGALSSQPQTYSYNGTSTTATDRRIRHPYTSVINIRNRTK